MSRLSTSTSKPLRSERRWCSALSLGLALAGCSSSLVLSIDAGQHLDAGQHRDGAPADEAADRLTVDASQCGTSINGYCKSDAGTCQTLFGPPFATDWNSELAKACSTSGRVTVVNCGNYMVLTLGSVDTSVTLYYLRSSGALVTIDQSSISEDYVCVAGAARYPVVCPTDAEPTSLCPPDGAAD